MLGVSAYGLVVRAQTPVAQRGNRAFLLGVSGVFAAAGIARAVWPSDEDPIPATIDANQGNANNGGDTSKRGNANYEHKASNGGSADKGSSGGAAVVGEGITRR
eukprot:jgi/Undpi1/7406/HiC_scaffold_22.g09879.m1